jgi:hypothetical protein
MGLAWLSEAWWARSQSTISPIQVELSMISCARDFMGEDGRWGKKCEEGIRGWLLF